MNFIFGLLVFFGIVGGLAFVIQKLAKAALRKIEASEKRRELENNIFVKAHKQMLKEDSQYKDYLEWMDVNHVPGVPFEQPKSHEQAKADKKIKGLFK